MAVPSLAAAFHTPAASHDEALSLICAGVLLAVFVVTLPGFLRSKEGELHEPPRWSGALTAIVLAGAAGAAALVSDWFVDALGPGIQTLHMSEDFAGLVVVAIAGNAVENVVGIQLAARNQADYAVSVILNSPLQIALGLTPILVLLSFLLGTAHLILVLPPLLVAALALATVLPALIVFDGESIWLEGVALIGLYGVIAAAFWWG